MVRLKNGTWKLTDAEMNLLSILAGEAEERYVQIGMYALANNARRVGKEIFDTLDNVGYYDDTPTMKERNGK